MKVKINIIIQGLFLLLFLISLNLSAQVYIDPNYNGPEKGTVEQPYNSWGDVSFTDNTTYYQKRGTIEKTTKGISLSQKNGITIAAYGYGVRPVFHFVSSSSKAIAAENCTNLTIRGIEIRGRKDYGNNTRGIQLVYSNTKNALVRIDSCYISYFYWGIHAWNNGVPWYDAVTITNTTIHHTYDDGIFLKNCLIGYFINDSVWAVNQGRGIWDKAGGDCIQQAGNYHYMYVGHCYLDHSGNSGKQTLLHSVKMQETGTILFEYNHIISPDTSKAGGYERAIYLDEATTNGIIRYNYFEGQAGAIWNNSNGLSFYGNVINGTYSFNYTLNEMNFYNNTFYHLRKVFYLTKPCNVKNNIFYKCENWGQIHPQSAVVYNCLYGMNPMGSNYINKDPKFISNGSDFRLQPQSPCINAGIDIKILNDFDGNTIPQGSGTDIGAFEYIPGKK